MKFYRKNILGILIIYFIFTLGWNCYLYFLPDHNTDWNYRFNILYALIYFFGGIISVFYAFVFGVKSNLGKMLLYLGSGLLLYFIALVIWYYYLVFLEIEVPYPSIADYAYLIFYLLTFIGSIYLIRIYKTFITKAIIRDSVLICLATAAVVFYIHTGPDFSSDVQLVENFVSIAYPVFDVIIMSVGLIAIRIGGGKLHPSFYLFSAGLLIQGIGDLIFDYRKTNGIYWNGDISDTFFMISGFILSISIFEIIHNVTQVSTIPSAQPSQSVVNDMKELDQMANISLPQTDKPNTTN